MAGLPPGIVQIYFVNQAPWLPQATAPPRDIVQNVKSTRVTSDVADASFPNSFSAVVPKKFDMLNASESIKFHTRLEIVLGPTHRQISYHHQYEF